MFHILVLNMNRDDMNAFLSQCRKTQTRHNKKTTGVDITRSQQSKKTFRIKSPESFNKQPTKTLKVAGSIPDWVIGIL